MNDSGSFQEHTFDSTIVVELLSLERLELERVVGALRARANRFDQNAKACRRAGNSPAETWMRDESARTRALVARFEHATATHEDDEQHVLAIDVTAASAASNTCTVEVARQVDDAAAVSAARVGLLALRQSSAA